MRHPARAHPRLPRAATGTYRWQSGVVDRVSADPAYCTDCTTGDDGPSMRADGSLVYRFQHCQGFVDAMSYACVGAIQATSGEAYPSCDTVGAVAANPSAAAQVAYTGCKAGTNHALVVTGPDRSGERVVACDDAEQRDPGWSPAGDLLVTAEDGTEPGIWVYAATNDGCFSGALRYAVTTASGTSLTQPAFVGSGAIVFEQGGELWSVPASCDHCAFPADARQLTTGANNNAPAWTSDPLAAQTTLGGTGTSTAASAPPGAPAPTPADTVAPVLRLGGAKVLQRVAKVRRVTVKVTSNEPGRLTVSGRIKVAGKDPVLRAKPVPVTAGKAKTIRIVLGTSAMRALRREWAAHRTPKAVLAIAVVDAAGNRAARTQATKLAR